MWLKFTKKMDLKQMTSILSVPGLQVDDSLCLSSASGMQVIAGNGLGNRYPGRQDHTLIHSEMEGKT
jgi:hypothetical protein